MAAEMKASFLCFAAVLLLGACGGDDSDALRQQLTALSTGPDVVVGIEARCDRHTPDNTREELSGDICRVAGTPNASIPDESIASVSQQGTPVVAYINRRQLLTVRTPQGTTYVVSVPINQPVKLGDPWPPK